MDPESPKGPSVTPETATFAQLRRKVRGPMPRRQASGIALLAPVLLWGCAVPGQLDLGLLGRDISGAAQEARLPPPGLDRPFPNLASVPPVPERPNPATRLAITQGLQAQRDLLNTPLADRRDASPLTEGPAPGQPPIPARPPAPVALARAPVIPWTTGAAPAALRPGAAPQTTAPQSGIPQRPNLESTAPEPAAPEAILPGEVPALPSADLLGASPPLAPRP
jgi:hypothetical protein